MKQNIRRLDVSVQDLLLMKDWKGTHQLREVRYRLNFIDHLVHLYLILKSAAVAEFIHQVIMCGSLKHFNESDDIGVIDSR